MSRTLACLIIGCVLLSSCGTASVTQTTQQSQGPSRFTYTRLFCTPDNESHFETVTIDLAKVDAVPPAPPLFVNTTPASRTVFAGFDAHWGAQDLQARKFRPAPSAQFVVYLQGVMSITTTDGETRHFRPGDVLRVEDTAPCKGHISVVGEKPAFTMISR